MTDLTEHVTPPEKTRRRRSKLVSWRTTAYQKVSGFFLTLILFLGVIVSALFLLWTLSRWAMQGEIRHSRPHRTTLHDRPGPVDENDFEVPSDAEVVELMTPSLQATLTAVTEAASETADSLEHLAPGSSGSGQIGPGHSSPGHSSPGYSGSGYSGPGNYPPDEHEDIVPRAERWQLNFSATDQHNYAVQLDFLHIELEQAILQAASVDTKDRTIVQFLPAELENKLAMIELEFAITAGHASVTEIARTVFQCVPRDDGYAFEVIDQRYRNK